MKLLTLGAAGGLLISPCQGSDIGAVPDLRAGLPTPAIVVADRTSPDQRVRGDQDFAGSATAGFILVGATAGIAKLGG